ncbi:ras-related protein Rab-20 [Heterodontus francisci]|uniref:ras-related protein Rab-20 n=1 Tax=Heterodontus francisci TaxID=7792 RepID=UPI00355B5CAA
MHWRAGRRAESPPVSASDQKESFAKTTELGKQQDPSKRPEPVSRYWLQDDEARCKGCDSGRYECGENLPPASLHRAPLPGDGREQFHGLGSMYCRGAAAVILTYDVTNRQSLQELEDRFLTLTDTAQPDCIFAVVGNKSDLTDDCAEIDETEAEALVPASPAPRASKQVFKEDAINLYKQLIKYKMLDEKDFPVAEKMCFETSAKTGYNVDQLFETIFELVVSRIVKKPVKPSETVDLRHSLKSHRTKSHCCT